MLLCRVDVREKTPRKSADNKRDTSRHGSSAETTSSSKEDVDKQDRSLVNKTTDKKKPTVIVGRKSSSLAWSRKTLKCHVKRYRLRCRQSRSTGVREKRRQIKPVTQAASNCTMEPEVSLDSMSNSLTATEDNGGENKSECVSDRVISAAVTDEEAESHVVKDDSIIDAVTVDESTKNDASDVDDTVIGELCVHEQEISVEYMNSSATTAVQQVDLMSCAEVNSSQEIALVEVTSAAPVAQTGDVIPALSTVLHSETRDVISTSSTALQSEPKDVIPASSTALQSETGALQSETRDVIPALSSVLHSETGALQSETRDVIPASSTQSEPKDVILASSTVLQSEPKDVIPASSTALHSQTRDVISTSSTVLQSETRDVISASSTALQPVTRALHAQTRDVVSSTSSPTVLMVSLANSFTIFCLTY